MAIETANFHGFSHTDTPNSCRWSSAIAGSNPTARTPVSAAKMASGRCGGSASPPFILPPSTLVGSRKGSPAALAGAACPLPPRPAPFAPARPSRSACVHCPCGRPSGRSECCWSWARGLRPRLSPPRPTVGGGLDPEHRVSRGQLARLFQRHLFGVDLKVASCEERVLAGDGEHQGGLLLHALQLVRLDRLDPAADLQLRCGAGAQIACPLGLAPQGDDVAPASDGRNGHRVLVQAAGLPTANLQDPHAAAVCALASGRQAPPDQEAGEGVPEMDANPRRSPVAAFDRHQSLLATRRPPPTSCAGSFRVAPAAVTSASLASMS